MELAAAKVLSCHVVLLCLLSVLLCSGIHDTDSLNCNLIVNYCELHGQCSVNGNRLLQFGDGKQEGDATELCPDLLQSLKDTLEVMWSLQSGNDALHVTIESKYKQGEFSNRCWAIIKVGQQCCFYIDPLQMTWRESHSDASGFQGTMEERQGTKNRSQEYSHGRFQSLPQEIVATLQRNANLNNHSRTCGPAFFQGMHVQNLCPAENAQLPPVCFHHLVPPVHFLRTILDDDRGKRIPSKRTRK